MNSYIRKKDGYFFEPVRPSDAPFIPTEERKYIYFETHEINGSFVAFNEIDNIVNGAKKNMLERILSSIDNGDNLPSLVRVIQKELEGLRVVNNEN